MTDAKKILTLLQSSDENNRLLAFQLMEGYQVFQEVTQMNESELIIRFFIPNDAQGAKEIFHYTKDSKQETNNRFVMNAYHRFWEINQLLKNLRFKRNPLVILRQVIAFIQGVKGYTNLYEILMTYQDNVFGFITHWIIDYSKKATLDHLLEKFEEEIEKTNLSIYTYQPKRRTKTPRSPLQNLARHIVNYECVTDYYTEPIPNEALYRFTFFVSIPIDDD